MIRIFIIILIIFIPFSASFGNASPIEGDNRFDLKPLDGITVQALESYPKLDDNTIGIGIGLYPFDPYYTGVLVNLLYQHRLNHVFSWEIINGNYGFSFQKSLTIQLANQFSVNPQVINRLVFNLSSNLIFTILEGKFLFLGESLRYFRTSIALGPSYVNTNLSNNMAVSFGVQFEILTAGVFSWRFDVRDSLTFSNSNYLIFGLNTGIHF